MKEGLFRKCLVFGVIVCFLGTNVLPSITPNMITTIVKADSGNVIYVPDDYPTIQAAVDAANPGDTIIVRDGTYTENINVNKDHLTVKSENGPNEAIVQAADSNDHVFEVTVDYVNISGFTVKDAVAADYPYPAGIYLSKANHCTIHNNNASNNLAGIELWASDDNTLIGNTVSSNLVGIYLHFSSNVTLTANNMLKDGVYIFGDLEHYTTQEIDLTNTVNGKPIYFWKNKTGGKVPEGAGEVILANCKNVLLENQQLNNGTVGIEVAYSSNITIRNITADSNNCYALYLLSSLNNQITNCTVYNSEYGLYLTRSSNNQVTSCTVYNNSECGIYLVMGSSNQITNCAIYNNFWLGILLYDSSYNQITNCAIYNSYYGTWLDYSSNNNIISNHIYDNSDKGIYLRCSRFNKVYHNNFIDNTNNVYSEDSNNIWNSTEPITYTYNNNTYINYLGNYWDDYTGNDTDGDGIGDSPYSIDGDNDSYPLMEPWENYSLQENHPPTVEITSPGNGETVSGTTTIQGVASDPDDSDTVERVEVKIDEGSWEIATGTTSWSYSWDTTMVDDGEHTIYARSYDGEDYSEKVFVNVDVLNEMTCAIELQRNGKQIGEISIRERFDIYVGNCAGDIQQIRFSSDGAQDGYPTGVWTKWYNWDTSSEDWNAEVKIKSWSFSTLGAKEVWVEIKNTAGKTNSSCRNIDAIAGYAVIVAGQANFLTRRQITSNANHAYRTLRNLGYDDSHIYYLNSNRPQNLDRDRNDEVDRPASYENFEEAISWAEERVNEGTQFILYLVGHGTPDVFFFDEPKGWAITSSLLNDHLNMLPRETPMLIVIDACYSGSFISSHDGSISIPDRKRVIITSARADQEIKGAMLPGFTYYSYSLWKYIGKGLTVKDAFIKTGNKIIRRSIRYTGLLDDNGDTIGHPPNSLGDDGTLAATMRVGRK